MRPREKSNPYGHLGAGVFSHGKGWLGGGGLNLIIDMVGISRGREKLKHDTQGHGLALITQREATQLRDVLVRLQTNGAVRLDGNDADIALLEKGGSLLGLFLRLWIQLP